MPAEEKAIFYKNLENHKGREHRYILTQIEHVMQSPGKTAKHKLSKNNPNQRRITCN